MRSSTTRLVLAVILVASCAVGVASLSDAAPDPSNRVEYFLVHQMDLYPGQESVGVSLKLDRAPAGERARVEILDRAGAAVLTQDLGALGERLSRPTLRVAGLREGDYRAVCVVTDAAGTEVGRDRAALRVVPVPEPRQVEIPIRVAYAPRTTTNSFPVTLGVPFARGALPAAQATAMLHLVDPSGAPVPMQSTVIAWWDPMHRYAQWVHLHFLATTPATGQDGYQGAPNETEGALTYTLRLLPQGAPRITPPLPHPARVTRGPAACVLDNGLLRVTLDPSQRNPFREIALHEPDGGALPLTGKMDTAGFFLRDEKGVAYTPPRQRPWKLDVEKEGPILTTVRLEAPLVSARGHEIGHLILRLRQAAGQPRLTISHTFVYTDVSETVQITAMGLKLPLRPAKTARVGLDEYSIADEAQLKDGPVRFLQSDWNHCTLEQGPPGRRKLLAFAHFAPGWMDLDCGATRAVATFPAGLFWKEYPKEFYVEPSGMTWIGLVPAHADLPMDLRTQTRGKWASGTGGEPGNWKATGFAKTHEFSFDFHRGERRPIKELLELTYGAPAAWADHAYTCATRVIEDLHPVDTGDVRAREWAATVHKYGWYGILLYGDAWNGQNERGWYVRRTGMMDFMDSRYHLQHEQIGSRWQANNWLAFMAGGNRQALEKIFTITRHMTDVDTIHAVPKETHYYHLDKRFLGSYLGGHHNHGGSQQHWSGKALPLNYEATPKMTPSLLCYYLTGWERAREVVEEWRQGLLANPEIPRDAYTTRRCMGPIEGAARLYRHTWDPRLLESARQHWNVAFHFHSGVEASPIETAGFWNNLPIIYYAAAPYYDLTHDERVEALLKETPPSGSRGTPAGELLAYRVSGDPEVLRPYLPRRLAELVAQAPPEAVRSSPAPAPPADPFDWMTKADLHAWVDPEDDLYGPALRRLAQQALREGKLSNIPVRRTVQYIGHRTRIGPRNAVSFIVKKEPGKPFAIRPISFFRNTTGHTYQLWNSRGQQVAAGPVEGLIDTQSSHENGRVTLPAELPAGLYRVRVAYRQGPPEREFERFGGYTEMSLTFPAGSQWMIETDNTGGYPGPTALYGEETFARFVAPEGAQDLEILLTNDSRIGRWVALVDPSGKVAAAVENGEKNFRTLPGLGRGLAVSPAPGTPITPGVWELGIQPNHAQHVHFLKGALPYMTFDPDAVLTAAELQSLPKTWEQDTPSLADSAPTR